MTSLGAAEATRCSAVAIEMSSPAEPDVIAYTERRAATCSQETAEPTSSGVGARTTTASTPGTGTLTTGCSVDRAWTDGPPTQVIPCRESNDREAVLQKHRRRGASELST
jgi:hypothetical protein